MSHIEKIVDRINRWWALVERLSNAFAVFGAGPWLAGVLVILLAWVGMWAAGATAFFRELAPFSYVVAALILAILGVILLRTVLGRNVNRLKETRVAFWTTLEYAPLLLSTKYSRGQYEHACAERDRWALVRSGQDSTRYERMLSARATDSSVSSALVSRIDAYRDTEEEAQARQAHLNSQAEVSYWLTKMRTEIEIGLLEGTLVAKGYRGTLKEHDQVETPVPVNQWVVLKADAKEKNVAKGDGITYSGVQVGRRISVWEHFAIKLRGRDKKS